MNKEELEKLTFAQKIDLIRNGNLFCPFTFWIGILGKIQKLIFSKATIFFTAFTIGFWTLIDDYIVPHWIIYACVGVMFIFTESLIELIKNKINVNINAEAKVGASANLDAKVDLNKATKN